MEKFNIRDVRDLFAKDLDRFLEITREQLMRVTADGATRIEAIEEASVQVHTLKGLAATVHAWGLSCWGADLERLFELARTLGSAPEKEREIFDFVLEHIADWEALNALSLDENFDAAWDHYVSLRSLIDQQWGGYLPAFETREALEALAEARSAPFSKPQPPDLQPPALQRLDSLPKPDEASPSPSAETRAADSTKLGRPELVPPQLVRKPVPTIPVSRAATPPTSESRATEETAPAPASRGLNVVPPTLKRKVKTPVAPQAGTPTPTPATAPAATVPAPVAVDPSGKAAGTEGGDDLLEMLGKEVEGYLVELKSSLQQMVGDLQATAVWENTRRLFHTIKGTAATFHLEAVSAPAKAAEARCIVATEDSAARTRETFECCCQRAEAIASALKLTFETQSLKKAMDSARSGQAQTHVETPSGSGLDSEMVGFFVRDSHDQIQTLEQAVLRWEKGEKPSEQVWAVQRSFHTIKGAANSIGLTAVAQSVHEVEAFLEGAAAAGATGSAALFAFLLGSVDQLRNYLRDLTANPNAQWKNDWHDALRCVAQPESAPAPTKVDTSVPAAAPVSSASKDSSDEEAHTLRIEAERLYELMNLIGEMVTDRSRLEKKIEQLMQLHRSLAERNNAMSSSIQSFQQQFEFNLLQDEGVQENSSARRKSHSRPRGIQPASGGSDVTNGGDPEFSELEFDRYDQFNILARSLVEISHDMDQLNEDVAACLESFATENTRFCQTSQHLQSKVTSLGMVPVHTLFPRLQRAFRDALRVEQKEADLVFEGGAALLDKVVVDKVFAPLLHLLRNAVAHGVEDTATRRQLKKAPRGTVKLSASQVSNQILIQVVDDGGGVKEEIVRRRAIERGWIPKDSPVLNSDQVVHYIFQPGFSTAEKVTSVSGRGIGLDVVRKEIEMLNGSVELRTQPDVGSTWTLRLPLTLTISEAILADCGGSHKFAFPINFIESGIILDTPSQRADDGRETVQVGENHLPIVRLSELLQLPGGGVATNGIIVSVGDRRAIVVVDRVLARQEIVIKRLDSLTSRHPLLNGATLDADGQVIPILNLPTLLKFSEQASATPGQNRSAKRVQVIENTQLRVLVVDDSLSVRKVEERLLNQLGCSVTTAYDGLNALEKLRECDFDFVFTDLEMPRLSGYELMSEIRSNPMWSRLPMVVISSRGADKYITKAMNLGAATFLSKPFTQEQLAQVLKFYAGWDSSARNRSTSGAPGTSSPNAALLSS